jgi:broad specificity phosphatase PhoE
LSAAEPCRLFLVRHGRTVLNTEGRFRGRQDPALDEQGWTDAHWASGVLAAESLEAVYTSPLTRARETAEAVARRHELVPKELPDLIDLDYGAWDGLTPDEAAERDPDLSRRFRSSPELVTLPGGEAMPGVADRVLLALFEIASSHPGASAVAVSHEIPIRLILARCRPEPAGSFWQPLVPPGCVLALDVGGGAVLLVRSIGALIDG